MTSAAFAAVRLTSPPEMGTSTMSTSPSLSRSAAVSSCPRSPRWQITRSSSRIAKTVLGPRADPLESSWNVPIPVTRTSWTSYSPGPRSTTGSPDRLETRVPSVVVGDGDDRRLGLGDGVSRLGVGRIGQHDTFAAAHTDAGVTEPGHVHGAGRE